MVDLVSLIHPRRVYYTTLHAKVLILDQSEEYTPEVKAAQTRLRNNAQKFHRQYKVRTANDLKENLPIRLQKVLTICSEKGASSWLSAVPISEHV